MINIIIKMLDNSLLVSSGCEGICHLLCFQLMYALRLNCSDIIELSYELSPNHRTDRNQIPTTGG